MDRYTIFKKVLRFTGVLSIIIAMVFAYRPMFTEDGKQYSNLVFILMGVSSVLLALGSNRKAVILQYFANKFPEVFPRMRSIVILIYAVAVTMLLVMGFIGLFANNTNPYNSIATGFLIFGLGGLVMLNNMLASNS